MGLSNKIILVFFVLILMVLATSSANADEIVTLNTRPGVTQSFLLLDPVEDPKGIVLLLPGHFGEVEFRRRFGHFSVHGQGGFTSSKKVIATYLERGMVVAVVAPPSDRPNGMSSQFRTSEEHGFDMRSVIDYLNARYKKALFIHGHCLSSLSVASVVTKLNNEGVSGLVLSSPRSAGRHGSVTDNTKGIINIPVLLVQHVEDPCKGTPFRNLGLVKAFFEASSNKVDVIAVSGGDRTQVGPNGCQNKAHSFGGLQKETADAIANWIQGRKFDREISR